MAVTKEQAVKAKYRDEFIGRGNGGNGKLITVRVNGACKTWKRKPDEFRLPVKYGLYDYGYIDHDNAHLWTSKGEV